MFTWIPIYAELAKKVLPYRNRQSELIGMVKGLRAQGLPVVSSKDHDGQKREIPLAVIDPFTFFACFNRGIANDNRRKILADLKTKFNLQSEVPEDFEGIPTVDPRDSWFFPSFSVRKPDDVPSLWALAESVVNGPPENVDPKLFERCLQIKEVGPPKLTMGMFWLNPKHYVALDENNRKLFERNAINSEVKDLSAYLQLIEDVKAKLGADYPNISRIARDQARTDAYLLAWNPGKWPWTHLGQAIKRLRSGETVEETWNVANRSIEPGDRVFLMRSGREPKGIIASGYAISTPFQAQHHSGEPGKTQMSVKVQWDSLKDPESEKILAASELARAIPSVHWFSRASGIKIPGASRAKLEELWKEYSSKVPAETHTTESGVNAGAKMDTPLNLILYGPPGTGKTYQTIKRAVTIIVPDFLGDDAAHK
jgi:hypothetical protein